ncbi:MULTISPECIES: tRNA uracil 4-sulfurtransferase ThiI [Bacillaceae]|uniref:tRNA uracil 4-sulfurtransferase ThiI n=1 Tax=Bacillaceae TaxID=186817 RepID=UPI00080AF87E|nr:MULTISPECIES: tRNA uracil 4-sulfurtransferase ThiI [Bacillaceae]OCA81934.1 tRNA 4-thiouridine(8) synthase ThiI [Bacillus sp. FJAT-27986]
MRFDHIVIRYGEITLKKRNRKGFIVQLRKNIKKALSDYPEVRIEAQHERMYVHLQGADYKPIMDILKKIYGISSISPALKVDKEISAIQESALFYINHLTTKIRTFKIDAKRADKTYPYSTYDLNGLVGGYCLQHVDGLTVDVHNPDLKLRVEVRQDAAYITGEKIIGAGGLPIGSSGSAMLMLSGGIDSPVAGYLTMKRGVEIECVHFYSPPFTSERSKQKVIDLANKLAEVNGRMVLHVVPFTEIQKLIQKQIPDNYTMTTTRRLMLRITDAIREKQNALAIVTGESLGQVASQTMESMFTINEVTNTPILRPLIAMDKTDIIEIAEKIDTHEISIRPFEDCCTVFTPANPKTKPKREKVGHYESYVDFEPLIKEALDKTEMLVFTGKEKESETEDLF